MSVASEHELALAVMDDDGAGCAITSTPALPDGLSGYLAAKHAYEDLVAGWGRTMTPGDPVPAAVKQAEALADALKQAGGYAGPDGAACDRRYGFLHEPVFSMPGCWQDAASLAPRTTTAESK